MSILNKIKNQSDGKKKAVSLFLALLLTLVIVVVWFSYNHLSSQTDEESRLSSISPMQMIKDEFSKVISNFKKENTNDELEKTSPIIIEEVLNNEN